MHKRNESSAVTAILSFLQCLENSGKICHVDRLNSGVIYAHGRKIRLCRPGTADIYVVLNNGGIVWIEVKAGKGEQDPGSQAKFQRKMEKAGHKYIIARSTDDIWAALFGNIPTI